MSHLNSNKSQTETAIKMDNHDSSIKRSKGIVCRIQQDWKNNGRLKFIIVALGFFLSYLYVGVFQEKIMRGCYGDTVNKDCRDGEKFKYAVTLVSVQFLCAYIFIKVLDLVKPEKKDSTHFAYYIGASMSNSLAMISSNMALEWVTYPMQVIFKSAKPISVMFSGLLICKRYTIQRYFFITIIVVGVIIFKLFESKEGKVIKADKAADATNWEQFTGIGLLMLSLLMDGILGVFQDRIRALYSPTNRQMMLSMSSWGLLINVLIILIKGEIFEVFRFASRHPNVIWHLFTLGIGGAVGQLFVFTLVSCFGSLACSVTGTVRKFFSVVLSILLYGNPSTPIQWIGAALVFFGLLADAAFGKRKKMASNEKDTETGEIGETAEKLIENPEKGEIISKNNTNHSKAAPEFV